MSLSRKMSLGTLDCDSIDPSLVALVIFRFLDLSSVEENVFRVLSKQHYITVSLEAMKTCF